jgi:hypothetical protein
MRLLKNFYPLILITFLSFSVHTAYAQYENTSGQKKEGDVKKMAKPQKQKKWFVGGMIGAGFSTYSSYVEISPIIGYEPIPNLQVATRLSYIYNSVYRQNSVTPYSETKVNLNHFGASLLARYIFFKGIFGQVEYEMLSYDDKYYNLNPGSPGYGQQYEDRIPINTLFLGGGFFQRFGNGFASFAILFPVAENYVSFYSTYVIRISFGGFF